jgi:HEAT repeat protein
LEDDASSARALAQAEAGQLSPEHAEVLHNARRHPKPAVRLFNLLTLIREHPGDPDTLKVLRSACLDPISKVRVRAAIELGDEARNVLLRIAEISSDDDACALAVSHLSSTLPLERVRDILFRALRKGFPQTARACLEVFGKSQDPGVFHVLAEVLAREKAELALAAARTLGATGSPAAEPPLLLALQREEPDLRVAAANGLGRIGSAVAVLPLMEAAESADDPDLLQAAHQAIAQIQSRLEDAAPGQLSLAATEAGQLSLAPSETGRLSLAVDPAGQLSLPPES